MARSEETPKEKALRALFRDVRSYLGRLERDHPAEATAARREIAHGAQAVAEQRAAWEKAHLPVTSDKLREAPPPTTPDAAPLYQELVRAMDAQSLTLGLWDIVGDMKGRLALSPGQREALRRLLADRQQVLDLIHEAGDRRYCSLRADQSSSGTLAHEHMAMQQAMRLLRAESVLLAGEGHHFDAIANQTRALRIAEHVAAEPVALPYLMSVAYCRQALDGMEDLLHIASADPAVMDAARQTITAHLPRLDLHRALIGDTVALIGNLGEIRREVREMGPAVLPSWFLWDDVIRRSETGRALPRKHRAPASEELPIWASVLDALEARELDHRRRLIAAMAYPDTERQRAFEQIDADLDAVSWNPVHLMCAPWLRYEGMNTKRARAQAHAAVLIAGAAALAFRARQRHFPERLDQISNAPPLDPFTQQPLRYCATHDGFRIESAGEEDREYTAPAAFGYPIAFTYPAPPPEPVRKDAR